MKYGWELAVYFTFFVFPFINDAFTDLRFVGTYLREFAKLGEINRRLQQFITEYYRWKKSRFDPPSEPQFVDFMELGPLQSAEKLFYQVDLSAAEASAVLSEGGHKLTEFARFIATHIYASVSENHSLLTNGDFIATLDPRQLVFDPELIARHAACSHDTKHIYPWGFDAERLLRLRGKSRQETAVCAAD